MTARFLTGPVAVAPQVHAAFCASPVSHRSAHFGAMMSRTRAALTSLVNASHVSLMVGSGTLANDAVAAQLTEIKGSGLILANGEFGDRLVDHARRWRLEFSIERRPWGRCFDWQKMRSIVERRTPTWIWGVLTETSTGVANSLDELRALGEQVGATLCLDAVSAIGLTPVDLRGVRFATAVSGKGLAAFPGLAAVFHDGRLGQSLRIPRYLDLAGYETADGVPFTHSSNLLAALDCSLSQTNWAAKFERVAADSRRLRRELTRRSLPPVAREKVAADGVVTVEIPRDVRTAEVASALLERGIEIAWQSQYLVERNWMQVALMGEVDETALRSLPGVLAACVERLSSAPCSTKHSVEPASKSQVSVSAHGPSAALGVR